MERFEVEAPVPGIETIARPTGVDLLVVHGMGGFPYGNPDTILASLRSSLNWVEPESWRDEHLEEGSRAYGRVRRHDYVDAEGTSSGKAIVYYWTSVTAGPKELYLGYDKSDGAGERRASINHALKRDFVVKNVPDLALYLGRHRAAIHQGLRRALELLAEGDAKRPIAIVTYSLGARIVVDLLADLAASSLEADRDLAARVFDRLRYVAFLSNQFALLELLEFDYARAAEREDDPASPLVARVSPALRRFDEELRRREAREGRATMPIVAVSDPNDLLSFEIPPWMRERLPGRFVNARVSVEDNAIWIPFVGDLVRPDRAHRGYAQSTAVLRLLMDGDALSPETPRLRHHPRPAPETEALPASP